LSQSSALWSPSSSHEQAEEPACLSSTCSMQSKGLCLYDLLKRGGCCGLPVSHKRHGLPVGPRQQPSPPSLLLVCFWKGGWGGEQGKRKPEP
jgi:hypothetical protein